MIRTRAFLRAYRVLPHRLVNGAAGRVARVKRPRALVRAAVRAWVERDQIDLEPFHQEDWRSLEHFFLRRLRPGARPIGEGFASPADGRVVGAGAIDAGTILQIKGRPLSVARMLGDDAARFEGGTYVTIFLRPKGYHYVHAPLSGELGEPRRIGGRFFPQNEDALQHIEGIYERNERAVLALRTPKFSAALVMVGASVVGGIHVTAKGHVEKGAEIGHFTFGSTVVVLLPPEARATFRVELGDDVKMGETLGAVDA